MGLLDKEYKMGYKRKTVDEYQIFTDYGYGVEHELTEDTLAEARQRVKEYRENCRELISITIVKKRIKNKVDI
jgi:hypothetical protein